MSRLFRKIHITILFLIFTGLSVAQTQQIPPPVQAITVVNATGTAKEVLELQQKIESAVISGDAAFAETVLPSRNPCYEAWNFCLYQRAKDIVLNRKTDTIKITDLRFIHVIE